MKTYPLRILLTGGGAPGTTGTSYMLNKGAASDGIPLELFATDSRDSFGSSVNFTKTFTIPPPESENYLALLNQIVSKEGIDLVVPQTTRESAFLSNHVHEVRTKVAVLPHNNFNLLNDKGALMESFREIGLPSVEVVSVTSLAEFEAALSSLGFPEVELVVKPLSSSGMRGVRKITNKLDSKEAFLGEKPHSWSMSERDLITIFGQGDWPTLLVMPYLDGPEYSVDVFRRSGKLLVLPRKRKLIRAGISMSTELDLNEEIVRVVTKFMTHQDIEGLLGFQFILHEGTPYVLESNPRVQGTMVSSLLSGVNLLWLEAKNHLGLPYSDEEWGVVHHSGEFVRTWSGELRFANGEIETI